MKYIEKADSPTEFEAWKEQYILVEGKTPAYNDLSAKAPEIKQVVKYALLMEQGSICCYCMADIDQTDSHIEHFIPRSKRDTFGAAIELDYQNLLASCNGWHGNREHCGHFKDDHYTELLLSPLDPDVEAQFTYSVNGDIHGITAQAAETIRLLKLDSFSLTRHRRAAIFSSGFSDKDFADMKDTLIICFQQKDIYGNYAPFCMAILYVMKHTPL